MDSPNIPGQNNPGYQFLPPQNYPQNYPPPNYQNIPPQPFPPSQGYVPQYSPQPGYPNPGYQNYNNPSNNQNYPQPFYQPAYVSNSNHVIIMYKTPCEAQCPHCHLNVMTRTEKKAGSVAWIVFLILFFFFLQDFLLYFLLLF